MAAINEQSAFLHHLISIRQSKESMAKSLLRGNPAKSSLCGLGPGGGLSNYENDGALKGRGQLTTDHEGREENTTLHLGVNEIGFFYCRVDTVEDPLLLYRYRSVINEKERVKADRYVFEKDRRNCLVTRALLRFVLSAYTALAPETFEFTQNEYGKPELRPGSVPIPIRFNISHSNKVTACALVLDSDIGIDIEYICREIDLDLANPYFTKSEVNYIYSQPAARRQSAFFDIWTLKESYIKAKGKGLSIDLSSFGFEIGREARLHRDQSRDLRLEHPADQWQFLRFSPIVGYQTAIAVRSSGKNKFALHVYECIPFVKILELLPEIPARPAS
jgi:4'-phosphopantetheinyl transferase